MIHLAVAALSAVLMYIAEGAPDSGGAVGSIEAGVRRTPENQVASISGSGLVMATVSMAGSSENESHPLDDPSSMYVRRQSRKPGDVFVSLPSSQKRKVAVIFRGESFRAVNNPSHFGGVRAQFGAHKRRTCEDDSLDKQRNLVDDHNAFIAKMDKLGVDVDLFGVTYACENGLDYASRLSNWYVPKMNLEIVSKERSLQSATMIHGLQMAMKTGIKYDGIYLLRWDYGYAEVFGAFNRSTCWVDETPRDLNSFIASNPDALQYIPGAHVEAMLNFMQLDLPPGDACCGPPCAQGCVQCIPNYLKHFKVKQRPCHPCVDKDACGYAKGIFNEERDEPLGSDEVWCKEQAQRIAQRVAAHR